MKKKTIETIIGAILLYLIITALPVSLIPQANASLNHEIQAKEGKVLPIHMLSNCRKIITNALKSTKSMF
ncbi:hypothetical protein [Staphylococcus caprae]|uniref:hypothetical protein n=1 Tax=Staphylococcus caprae TaxID=29380 RepID=UPI001C83B3C1|nr:hypothetical protein [Staphylococcus caprae]MBX5317019.1 hypothetical protein [Staphylococcus caprae]MBX5324324.1 hypothetical protein [Staphylococcus caprae]